MSPEQEAFEKWFAADVERETGEPQDETMAEIADSRDGDGYDI